MDVRCSGTEALGLEEWQERYARQLLLPEVGREGQELLARKSIAVIGAGGLGSTLLPVLVGAGVGEVLIVDSDVVSRSNLPRQTLYTTEVLGEKKALLAAQRLKACNPHCTLTTSTERLSPTNAHQLLSGKDLILDATDNEEALLGRRGSTGSTARSTVGADRWRSSHPRGRATVTSSLSSLLLRKD